MANAQQELGQVNYQLNTTNQQLQGFNDPQSYLHLLQVSADASYAANKDVNDYLQSARTQLYSGQPIINVPNYANLSPDQQSTIRNAARASLTAGIQTGQDVLDRRQNNVANILQQAGETYKARRQSLTDTINQLSSRRSELEAQTKPTTMEKNGVIVGIDPTTGKIVFRTDTGLRDQSGGGSSDWSAAQKIQHQLPKGYGFNLQTTLGFNDWYSEHGAQYKNPNSTVAQQAYQKYASDPNSHNGVDFFGPKGKITREDFTNQTGVSWQDAAQAIGSLNPNDWAGTTTGGRLSPAATTDPLKGSDITDGVNYLASQGATAEQVRTWLRTYTALDNSAVGDIVASYKPKKK